MCKFFIFRNQIQHRLSLADPTIIELLQASIDREHTRAQPPAAERAADMERGLLADTDWYATFFYFQFDSIINDLFVIFRNFIRL